MNKRFVSIGVAMSFAMVSSSALAAFECPPGYNAVAPDSATKGVRADRTQLVVASIGASPNMRAIHASAWVEGKLVAGAAASDYTDAAHPSPTPDSLTFAVRRGDLWRVEVKPANGDASICAFPID